MSEFLQIASTAHGLITLLVFAGSILLFVTGWLAPEVTGLLAAALLVAFKVLKPDQAVQGFGSPALITLMGLFAVSAGLFRSGGLDRLRAMIASDLIRSPRRLIVLMLAVVSPISGFIPNTPIVATLLPVLEGWCQRRRISPSRVMLPMAFAVVLGGTISLLGTSTNLLASDVSRQLGFGSIELFDFTAIGIPIWLLGGLYMVLVSDRLLPDRGLHNKNDLVGDLARAGYLTEVLIPEGSTLIGQTLHNSRLQRRFDVDVLELQRGSNIFSAPLADRVLQAADRLVLRCNKETLLRLQQDQTVILSPANEQDDAIKELSLPAVTTMRMVEVLLPSGSTLAGTSVRDLRFRQRYNANILAVRRGNQMLRELLGQVVLKDGDVLLLQAPVDPDRHGTGQRPASAADGLHLRHSLCRQPELPHAHRLSVQPDGVRPRPLSLPRHDPLRRSAHPGHGVDRSLADLPPFRALSHRYRQLPAAQRAGLPRPLFLGRPASIGIPVLDRHRRRPRR